MGHEGLMCDLDHSIYGTGVSGRKPAITLWKLSHVAEGQVGCSHPLEFQYTSENCTGRQLCCNKPNVGASVYPCGSKRSFSSGLASAPASGKP